MFDAIGRIFQGFIDFLQPILIPDWRALIDLLPIFLLIGVVGPLLSLLIFGWVIYVLGKPRSRIPYVDPQPQLARIVDGEPVYPVGRAVLRLQPAGLPAGHDPVLRLRARPRRDLPEVQHGPPGLDRHVRHVRARPAHRPRRAPALPGEGAPPAHAVCRGAARARPDGNRVAGPVHRRHDHPRVRVRGDDRARGDACQRPPLPRRRLRRRRGRRRPARLGGRRDRILRGDARRRPPPRDLPISRPRRRCQVPHAG